MKNKDTFKYTLFWFSFNIYFIGVWSVALAISFRIGWFSWWLSMGIFNLIAAIMFYKELKKFWRKE